MISSSNECTSGKGDIIALMRSRCNHFMDSLSLWYDANATSRE